jgi:hypothetical protein
VLTNFLVFHLNVHRVQARRTVPNCMKTEAAASVFLNKNLIFRQPVQDLKYLFTNKFDVEIFARLD